RFRRRLAARPLAGWAMAASLVLAVGLGGFLAGRGTSPTGGTLQQAAVALAQVPTGGRCHPVRRGGRAGAGQL
ncbi:hypothetical protein, partial [Paracoccus sp. PAMC 22219]|uniref:hypothetical protein n=1 Tax=Paracoccus sp. PAMC 22219 TaxID=1569209 RepID=UPI0005AA6E27